MADLEKAKAVAKQFGGEAQANNLVSWSKDDRQDIAEYYGAKKWSDISVEHQTILFLAYRYGERLERAKSFAQQLVVEYTKDWVSEDWEASIYREAYMMEQLVKRAEEMLDKSPDLYGDIFSAKFAFERHMGW
jgi:hypothetical protein